MNQSKSIHLVDISKFLSALLVVAIHAQPFRYHDIIQVYLFWPIVSLAVPYFLIVSAYFFWNREKPNLRKYLFRIGTLYIIWLIIDFPILYKQLFTNGASLVHNAIFFIRGLLFGQTFPGSWYLSCSIWAIIISYIAWKKKVPSKYLIMGGAFLYILGKILIYFQSILPTNLSLFAEKFYRIYGVMQISTFTYFIFVFIGYVLVVNRGWFSAFKSGWWFILGIIITIIELSFNNIYEFPISIIAPLMIIPYFLVFTVTTPLKIPDVIAIRIRKMSTLIFFIHPTFVRLYPPFGEDFVVSHPICNYAAVCLLSMIIAYILSSSKLLKKLPVIKYLY